MTDEVRTPEQVDAEVARQERRLVEAALERTRIAAIIDASPACARDGCGHKLCYHDPCSKCSCQEFEAESE